MKSLTSKERKGKKERRIMRKDRAKRPRKDRNEQGQYQKVSRRKRTVNNKANNERSKGKAERIDNQEKKVQRS